MAELTASYNAFPSDFAPKSEKLTKEYGIKYFSAMWSVNRSNYYGQSEQRGRYIINRKFAEGLQDINDLKNFMSVDGDLSYLNLDFHPVNRIATIVDNMVGLITNYIYKIQCQPNDVTSKSKYDAYRNKIKANMILKELQEQMGDKDLQLVPKGAVVPEDNDELELHMAMNFKLDEAVAMEMALEWIFQNNNFDRDSLPKMVRDMIVDKKTCVYRYYDKNNNIRVERFDHIDLLTPYSKKDDFSNITYQGLIREFTIGEIAEMNPDFTDEELYDIAKSYAGKNKNPLWNTDWATTYEGYYSSQAFAGIRPFQNFFITVMHGYFLTPITEKTSVIRHKNSKTKKVKLVTDEEIGADFKIVDTAEKKKLYRMEGMWIPDSEYIWNYGFSKNIEREVVSGGYSPDCELPCVIIAPNIYDMQNKSLVERMIPLEKQLNLIHLKFQQFMIKAVPPGVAIDERGLNASDVLGQGNGKQKHSEKYKQYAQTGSFTFNGWDEFNNQAINMPFHELAGGMSPMFQQLIQSHNFYMQQINEVVGFNTAVDASSPDVKTAVGTSQMAQKATYNTMKWIYRAVENAIERSAKRLSLMVQDSIKYNNKAFVEAIGQSNVDVLTKGRDMSFGSEAISIELQNDENDVANLNNLIALGVQNQVLTPSDVLRVQMQMKTNIKLAGQLLVFLEAKNRKAKLQESAQMQQQNAQLQQQSAQMASQAKQQEIQLESQAIEQRLKTEYGLKSQFETQLFQQQMQLQEKKNEGLYTVAGINNQGKVNVQNASNQGKIVEKQVESQTQREVAHIKHGSEIHKMALANALDNKEEE